MTVTDMWGLFLSMVLLGAVPSVSVLAVIARSAEGGFAQGVYTTLGIVLGDILYILLAVFGLSFLASSLGAGFVVVKYLASFYLIFLGLWMWRNSRHKIKMEPSTGRSSFFAGFFITLADQKAILFYLGFLPAFVDLSKITLMDTGVVMGLATLALAGTKLSYAFLADKAAERLGQGRMVTALNRVAACVMMGVGFLLAMT